MTDKLRVVVIGIDHPHGMGWRESLCHVANELEITAIVPAFENSLGSLEERLAKLPRFDSVECLIEKRRDLFDAALVCLPNDKTLDTVIQLALAGKHVLIEKPGVSNSKDARRLAEAVRSSKVQFQSGFIWRYDELANRLKDMIKDGRFGRLISVEMTYSTSNVIKRDPNHYLFDKKQSRGGFFNWLASHHIDLLFYVTGMNITAVTSRVGVFSIKETELEDGGTAIFDLSGGGLATFTGGYWHPRWINDVRWTLRGTERWVHWDPHRKGTGGVLEIHGAQPHFMGMDEVFKLPPDILSGYGGQKTVELLKDWIRAISKNLDCRNTPESLISIHETIDAIYDSSEKEKLINCNINAK